MDVQAIDQSQTAAYTAAASAQQSAPGLPAFPQAAQPGAPAPAHGDETLHSALAQLVGGGSDVSVQFQVSHDPNEVVTVFKNAQTGEVMAQFPRESMVLIAQFFNKLAGAVVDRSA